MSAQLIVVIEDDLAICDLVRQLFTDEGYQVECAYTGDTAFGLIQQHTPDAIILDIHLAGTSGLRLIESLRAHASTRDTPIIVCSADAQLLRRYANDLERLTCAVLAKPFDIDTLVETVKECMKPPTLEFAT